MAKSKETFNKKEKEKQRLKQKQEKKQKQEERKANKKKGTPLEDMMAYVDENGNLSNRPPDERKKVVYNAEDIQIGVPRQEEMPEVFNTGIVNFFDKSKGFGFIIDQSTRNRIFFHINNLLEDVNESDKVQFLTENGARGLSAVQVSRIK
ncbi:MAG: cold shock domain-containing protein [Chitinophagaceae bacterium]|nr:cold shock domain-containing protein [Chitinophagaceae bacterium]